MAVLVVDDDSRVRASLIRLLDDADSIDVIAVTADQARRMEVLSASIDVAVVDVPGTDGDGLRLVAKLAASTAVIAVGLLTSMGNAARGAGAVAFVEKDGDGDKLLSTIRHVASVRALDEDAPSSLPREEG